MSVINGFDALDGNDLHGRRSVECDAMGVREWPAFVKAMALRWWCGKDKDSSSMNGDRDRDRDREELKAGLEANKQRTSGLTFGIGAGGIVSCAARRSMGGHDRARRRVQPI